MKTKLVIFDFDGVLLESVDVKTKAFAAMFEKYGMDVVEKVIAYHLENGGISRYEKFRYFYKNLLDKELSEEEEIILGERFSSQVYEGVLNAPYVEGAYETLNFLNGKIPMVVASGTPHEELLEIVKKRNMDRFFAGVYGSPESKTSIIIKCMILHNVEPQNTVMVGDAMSDYQAAMETSVRFIGRTNTSQNTFLGLGVEEVNNLTGLSSLL